MKPETIGDFELLRESVDLECKLAAGWFRQASG